MDNKDSTDETIFIDEKTVPQYDPVPAKPYTEQPTVVTYEPHTVVATPPKDYILHSVLVILCCFWPLGIIGFYKAYQARRFYQDGKYAEAESASKDAGQFTKFGCIIGCLLQGLTWGIMVVVYGILGITFGVLAAVGVFDNATRTS